MPKLQVVLIFFSVLFFFNKTSAEIVQIEDGQIEGAFMTSRLGKTFQAFLRIPFAAPPLGEFRFQAPKRVKPWSGIRNGTYYGAMCVQPNARPDYVNSEDCLQLNVYTTSLIASKPVIVYIHGGSLSIGSGIDQGGPQNLMDREVVVVSINYRLGALGFLATGTADVPGNAGMKDQVMALKWVQKNIEKFGGNPNKVTIAGLSAGALSVTAHMISTMSQNLFHRVIAISGSISFEFKDKFDNLKLANKIGKELNCAIETIEDLISCLRTVKNLLCV
jgi:acetylcholinesterase